MIFVTVGTHEQPFNRLVKYMDKWAEAHEEEVIIQTGFCTFEPKKAKWENLFPYKEMVRNVDRARIVITHGGPSSFIMPLQAGKVPIVVPRQRRYDEHVNDHQLEFCKQVAARQGNIIIVENISDLGDILLKYDDIVSKMGKRLTSNNEVFNNRFKEIIKELGL